MSASSHPIKATPDIPKRLDVKVFCPSMSQSENVLRSPEQLAQAFASAMELAKQHIEAAQQAYDGVPKNAGGGKFNLGSLASLLGRVAELTGGECARFSDVAVVLGEFSILPHASWLAKKSWTIARRQSHAASARSNGRRRRGSKTDWAPRVPVEVTGSFHDAMAKQLLSEIEDDLRSGAAPNPGIQVLIHHKISVRVERAVECLLREPRYEPIKKLLPRRWSPRPYFVKTKRGYESAHYCVKRKIASAVRRYTGTPFFVRVDWTGLEKAEILGPFSDSNDVRLSRRHLAETDIFVRGKDSEKWRDLELKRGKPFRRGPRMSREEWVEQQSRIGHIIPGYYRYLVRWEVYRERPPQEFLDQVRQIEGRNALKMFLTPEEFDAVGDALDLGIVGGYNDNAAVEDGKRRTPERGCGDV